MIVSMSWVSFWLGVDAVPGRVALSVTSLLTLCTQVEQSKSQLPPVNYIKAMDIWLFVCIIMVFSTLVEFAISYNMHTKKCEKCSKRPAINSRTGKIQRIISNRFKVKSEGKPGVVPWILSDNDIRLVRSTKSELKASSAKEMTCPACYEKHLRGQRVDSMCKIIFPLSFCIFAFIYWIYYMSVYEGNNW
ncbi:Glycine receptor subunit alpha-2, partial [Stegodyphus mimosarum]